MGWHDTLAEKSAEQGKTSADFRAGARRKAKATILFLLLAGVVGYLAGWPFRPFVGVAPRLYRRAFLKDRELKNKDTGEFHSGKVPCRFYD